MRYEKKRPRREATRRRRGSQNSESGKYTKNQCRTQHPLATIMRGGSAYHVLSERAAEGRAGPITLYLVEGYCDDCGYAFHFEITKGRLQNKYQRRRCDLHKRPGVPSRGILRQRTTKRKRTLRGTQAAPGRRRGL